MRMTSLPQEHWQGVTVDCHLLVPVPWDRALALRERLLRRGIKSIARFDPAGHQARLEILADVDLSLVKTILKGNPQRLNDAPTGVVSADTLPVCEA
jgi:hypothetical protein